jgi:hypothetical protein
MKPFYPKDYLFTEAQVKSDVLLEESYFLIDNTQVDNQTGTYKKIQTENKISVRTLTFECRFSSTAVAAVAANN